VRERPTAFLAVAPEKRFVLDAQGELPVDDLRERLIRQCVSKIPKLVPLQFVMNAAQVGVYQRDDRGMCSGVKVAFGVFRYPIELPIG
jgi:hypothetical protein